MNAHAVVRDPQGNEGRLTCSAARAGTSFQGECHDPRADGAAG